MYQLHNIYELNVQYNGFQISNYLGDDNIHIKGESKETFKVKRTHRVLFDMINNYAVIICVRCNSTVLLLCNDDRWQRRELPYSYLYHNHEYVYFTNLHIHNHEYVYFTDLHKWCPVSGTYLYLDETINVWENDYYVMEVIMGRCRIEIYPKSECNKIKPIYASYILLPVHRIYPISVKNGHCFNYEIFDSIRCDDVTKCLLTRLIKRQHGRFIQIDGQTLDEVSGMEIDKTNFWEEQLNVGQCYYIWDQKTKQTRAFGYINKNDVCHVVKNWKLAFLVWCFKQETSWNTQLNFRYYMPLVLIFKYIFK